MNVHILQTLEKLVGDVARLTQRVSDVEAQMNSLQPRRKCALTSQSHISCFHYKLYVSFYSDRRRNYGTTRGSHETHEIIR